MHIIIYKQASFGYCIVEKLVLNMINDHQKCLINEFDLDLNLWIELVNQPGLNFIHIFPVGGIIIILFDLKDHLRSHKVSFMFKYQPITRYIFFLHKILFTKTF